MNTKNGKDDDRLSDYPSLVDMAKLVSHRFNVPIDPKRIDGEKFLRELSQSKNVTTKERYNIIRIIREIEKILG